MSVPAAPPPVSTAAAPARAVRACLFTVGGQPWAIHVGAAREVVIVEQYTIVPRAAEHLLGVANLRGYVLPIFDIRTILGLPVRPLGQEIPVMVVQAGAVQAGLVIEAIQGLESFDDVLPLGDAARREYGEFGIGLLRRGDEVVTLLDPAHLLGALAAEA